MEIKKFIENFAINFDDTDTTVFIPQTEFRELDEWSSMLALSTMAMISEEYDVEITPEEIRKARTIEDLFNAVKSYL